MDTPPFLIEDQYLHSSAREKLLEHLFVGEILKHGWLTGRRDIEVLRGEVDRGGYDVVVESEGIIRHVQLKSSYQGAGTPSVNVNMSLSRKPSGCIIWIRFDPNTLELGPFLWFGGVPGQPLPTLGDKIARHTKGNAQGLKAPRPNIRVVKRTQFEALTTIELVMTKLFGPRKTP